MNQRILAGILAVQVIIVVIAFVVNLQKPEVPETFVEFDLDALTSFTVASADEQVAVTKDDDSWRLADGKPADGDKIERVLAKLLEAEAGYPVSTTTSSARRFEVVEEEFQKRLTLNVDDEVVGEVYFGTSPGFRKVHARPVDSDAVYAIEFSSYELGSDKNSWLDKGLLKADGAVTQIENKGAFTLSFGDQGWASEPVVELDEEEVDSFVKRFQDLSVYEISAAELPETPTAELVVTDAAGEYDLTVYHIEDGDDWTFLSTRVSGQYNVSSYIAKEIVADLSELAVEEEAEEEDTEAAESAANPEPVEATEDAEDD